MYRCVILIHIWYSYLTRYKHNQYKVEIVVVDINIKILHNKLSTYNGYITPNLTYQFKRRNIKNRVGMME